MRNRYLAFALLVIAWGSLASAQDCVDYSRFDHWVPTPWLAENEIADSVRWGAAGIVFVGSGGVVHLDFADPEIPALLGRVEGGYSSMDIDGNLLAVGRRGGIDLFTLPSLNHVVTIETGSLSTPAVKGRQLAVVTTDSLFHYDIIDPYGPILVGAAYHGKAPSRMKASIVDGHVLVPWLREAGLWDTGGMFVAALRDSGTPVITQPVVALPFTFESRYWFQGVFAVAGKNYAWGDPHGRNFDWGSDGGFIAEFQVSETGQIEWGAYGSIPDRPFDDVAVVDGGVLVSARYHPYSDDPYLFGRQLWLAELPTEDSTLLAIEPIAVELTEPVVCYLPDKSILANGSTVYSIADLSAGLEVMWRTISNNHGSLEIRDGRAAQLKWWTASTPGGCRGWTLGIFDITGGAPAPMSSIRWSCGEYYMEMHWIGNHFFLRQDDGSWFVIDATDDLAYADFVPIAIDDTIDLLEAWDRYFRLQEDGTVSSHAIPESAEPLNRKEPLVSRKGHLARHGDHLYAVADGGANLFDVSNPEQPELLSFLPPIHGRVGSIVGTTMITFDGGRLMTHDIAEPTGPIALGEWESGAIVLDLVATENRVYALIKDLGVAVLELDRAGGIRYLGGSLLPAVPEIVISGTEIYISGYTPEHLPLDCNDSVPTMITGFEAVHGSLGVDLVWACREARFGDFFRVVASSPAGGRRLIAALPAEVRRYAVCDDIHATGTSMIYDLELESDTGTAILASVKVEPRSTGAGHATLTVTPNPANPKATIEFTLDRAGPVRLDIYALDGRRVATLVEGELAAGTHSRSWNGRDATGRDLASGVYLVRLVTATTVTSGRLMLLR